MESIRVPHPLPAGTAWPSVCMPGFLILGAADTHCRGDPCTLRQPWRLPARCLTPSLQELQELAPDTAQCPRGTQPPQRRTAAAHRA